jgi:hypothetical protein
MTSYVHNFSLHNELYTNFSLTMSYVHNFFFLKSSYMHNFFPNDDELCAYFFSKKIYMHNIFS